MTPHAGGPVIPNFGHASSCVTQNRFFCTDWVRAHWDDTLQPALVQHVRLSAIAVSIGFVLAFALALLAYRVRRLDHPIGLASDFLYTIPSLALFQLLVPITGLSVTTVEVALVSYTLLILIRNIVAGLASVPSDVREAAEGMGYSRSRQLARVELPLALPVIVAGIRIAVVTTIGLVTVTALIGQGGLGQLILDGLYRDFRTEVVVGSVLCVVLAIVADLVLVGIQRIAMPWTRKGATT